MSKSSTRADVIDIPISSQETLTVENISERFLAVRSASESLCAPLEIEDYGIQTMVDVSPPKWHLAHTSWFFETFLLKPFYEQYREYRAEYAQLFNSYYEQVGVYHPRPQRGFLSRPTVKEVYEYRRYVDENMQALLAEREHEKINTILHLSEIGLNHEQQHQELLLTDIKHILGMNPLRPAYRELPEKKQQACELNWQSYPGGMVETGFKTPGFCYDNEMPRHAEYLQPFKLASRLVTNKEYLEFIQDAGYQRPELWLSEAWAALKEKRFSLPLYWESRDGEWLQMTLAGLRPLDLEAPVCHVNYYEACAYAEWVGKRLPRETEWESVAATLPIEGNLRDAGFLQPVPGTNDSLIQQMFGDVWEWTQSAYAPYPGFRAPEGALGEYNGKFMCGQYVLRGGSCVTPADHIRASYRNFFYPKDQWQFSGIRLAEDIL